MEEILLKIRYFERLSKSIEKVFFFNPVPFNGQDYGKQKGPGTSDQETGFDLFPKNTYANKCKPIS